VGTMDFIRFEAPCTQVGYNGSYLKKLINSPRQLARHLYNKNEHSSRATLT